MDEVSKLQELSRMGVLSDEARARVLQRLGEHMQEQVQEKKVSNDKKMIAVIHRILETQLSSDNDLSLV